MLARARAGAEVVIEDGASAAVVLWAAPDPNFRLLHESLRLAELRGSTVTLDEDFGRDLEDVIASHTEPVEYPWA